MMIIYDLANANQGIAAVSGTISGKSIIMVPLICFKPL